MTRRLVRFGWVLFVPLAAAAEAKEPPKPKIEFLGKEQAAAAIADESLEPYFSLLQKAEMEAKTGGTPLGGTDLAAQRVECRQRYQAAVRAFSDEEQRALTTLVERLHGAWAERYPRLADVPWSFLGTEEVIEGGLPHTRGRSIVIPKSVGTAIVRSLTAGETAVREQLSLLAHEQCHVLQRVEPKLFDALYLSWGFVKVAGLAPAPQVLARHVVNPDGVRTEWVFPLQENGATIYLHPLVALRDLVPPHRMPDELEMIAVEVEKDGAGFRPKVDASGAAVVRSLPEQRAYGARFGGIFENFHPNEIFAVLLSAIVMKDHFGGEGLPESPEVLGKDGAKLRSWCTKNFARKAAPAR